MIYDLQVFEKPLCMTVTPTKVAVGTCMAVHVWLTTSQPPKRVGRLSTRQWGNGAMAVAIVPQRGVFAAVDAGVIRWSPGRKAPALVFERLRGGHDVLPGDAVGQQPAPPSIGQAPQAPQGLRSTVHDAGVRRNEMWISFDRDSDNAALFHLDFSRLPTDAAMYGEREREREKCSLFRPVRAYLPRRHHRPCAS